MEKTLNFALSLEIKLRRLSVFPYTFLLVAVQPDVTDTEFCHTIQPYRVGVYAKICKASPAQAI